jgi:FAD dependent oxidoreductase TIGR03364
LSNTFDVVVVGAGIVGTFHAYFAAQRGLKTLVVDRDPGPRQATVRNFGMIVSGTIAAPGDWDGFARRTSKLYRQLEEESEEDLTIRHRGSLYVVETELEDRVIREYAELSSSLGKRAEYLAAEDLIKDYEFVGPDYARGGLLFPDDMSLDPRRFIHLLLEQLSRDKNFRFKADTCVVGIEAEANGCKVVDGDGNQYSCGTAVVCSGVEYRILCPDFCRESGMEICKIDMLRAQAQPNVDLRHNILSGLSVRRYPGFEVCTSYADLMATPIGQEYSEWGIHLLLKQADDGTVIIGDSHQYFPFDEPTGFDNHAAVSEAILAYGKRMVHLDNWNIGQSWAGYVMSHPDKNVVVGQVAPSVHVALGIAGKGMSTAPGFAEANMARILETI